MEALTGEQATTNRWRKLPQLDPVLTVALLAGLAFGLYGITWGNGESWNPDEMAFRALFSSKTLPFEPMNFYKPPFHTYFNYFLCVYPADLLERIARKLLGAGIDFDWIKILWARSLTIGLFLGAIALTFQITKRFYGLPPARIITLLFATSAGFVVEAHFLTADMPVLFWMLLAFYFIQSIVLSGQWSAYLWAGFLTGITTAVKYNGLGVGIAIPLAHLLRINPFAWRPALLDPKLYAGLAMVVVGFIMGNPFAIITFEKFIAHFWYNYKTTPVFDGSSAGTHSYGDFLYRFTEILGWPATIGFAIAALYGLYFLAKIPAHATEKQGFLLLLAICLLYYYKFGDFPRIETRFVVPIVPFFMMMAGPLLQQIKSQKTLILAALIGLVAYNSVCSLYVGKRFTEDPRMIAKVWVKENVPANSTVESMAYSPNLRTVPGLNLEIIGAPFITGRRSLFEQVFQNDPWMLERVQNREREDRIEWYQSTALMTRNPDYIAINSIYYERFFSGRVAELYASIRQFFQDLLDQNYPYKIAFDQTAQSSPPGLYPNKILFVDNRMIILKRQ